MISWQAAKRKRMNQTGSICELCGKRQTKNRNLVGHHVIPKYFLKEKWVPILQSAYGERWIRAFQRFFHRKSLIRIRCATCESKIHKSHKWGNMRADNIMARRYLGRLTGIVSKSLAKKERK